MIRKIAPHERIFKKLDINLNFSGNRLADGAVIRDFISGMNELLNSFQEDHLHQKLRKATMQSLWNRSITKWAYCAAFCLSLFLLTPSQASADDVRPQITDFTWSNPWANYFVFYGTVSDDLPEGCLVKFGGLIEGAAATVYEDGSFCLIAEIPEGANGEVFAICMDIHGNLSEVAFAFIF